MSLAPPVVSVVVPIYKVEVFLEQCVDSILAQTLHNIEIILVDDGSPDNCPAMCDAYAARDARVQVIHRENQGAGSARNEGMAAAKGEYIIFLDSDDIYEPDMLERMVCRAQKHAADIVICRADAFETPDVRHPMPHQLRDELLKTCNPDAFCPVLAIPQNVFQFCVGWPWDKLYRHDFLRQTGLQYQNLRHTNDAFFVYLSLAKAAVVSIEPTILVHHRQHTSSISHNTDKNTSCMLNALLAIHDQLLPMGNEEVKKSFYRWAMNMSVWHYRQLSGPAAAEFRRLLREDLEPRLQLLSKGSSYYPRKRDWKRYKKCVNPKNGRFHLLTSWFKKLFH